MSVTPISRHPRFVQTRPPRFQHIAGKIVAVTSWGLEALRLEDALTLSQELQAAGRANTFHAVQAKRDHELLRTAWREYRDFWAVAKACTGATA